MKKIKSTSPQVGLEKWHDQDSSEDNSEYDMKTSIGGRFKIIQPPPSGYSIAYEMTSLASPSTSLIFGFGAVKKLTETMWNNKKKWIGLGLTGVLYNTELRTFVYVNDEKWCYAGTTNIADAVIFKLAYHDNGLVFSAFWGQKQFYMGWTKLTGAVRLYEKDHHNAITLANWAKNTQFEIKSVSDHYDMGTWGKDKSEGNSELYVRENCSKNNYRFEFHTVKIYDNQQSKKQKDSATHYSLFHNTCIKTHPEKRLDEKDTPSKLVEFIQQESNQSIYAYEDKPTHNQKVWADWSVYALTLLSSQVFASGTRHSSEIAIWQLVSGEAHRLLSLRAEATVNKLTALDDKNLACSHWRDKHVGHFDISSAKKVREIDTSRFVYSLAKLSMQIVAFGTDESEIKLWDIRASSSSHTWLIHNSEDYYDEVHSLLALDEKRVLSVSSDNTARLWDLRTYRSLVSFEAYGYKPALLPNNQVAYSTTDQKLGIFNFNSPTPKIERIIPCKFPVDTIAALKSGLIMTGGEYQKDRPLIEFWNPSNGKRINKLSRPQTSNRFMDFDVNDIVALPEEGVVALALGGYSGGIRLFSFPKKKSSSPSEESSMSPRLSMEG